jgi:hypothetical protein
MKPIMAFVSILDSLAGGNAPGQEKADNTT